MDDRGSNGTGSSRIKVRPDTAKLTNVTVTGFGERCKCNLVRESKMFVKDEAEVWSRVGGVKLKVVYFDDESKIIKKLLLIKNTSLRATCNIARRFIATPLSTHG